MADNIDGGIIKIGVDVDLEKMEKGFLEADKIIDESANSLKKTTEQISDNFDKMIKTGDKMKKVGSNLTKFVTLPIAGIAAASVNLAMEAVESENLFTESFGNMADKARDWSEELSKALGLNAYELRRNSGMFYVMMDAMGLSEEASYDMATSLTELAGDMASFYNIDIETAIEKLRGGITGEAEGLKQFGIIVNETTVGQYALANGIGSTGDNAAAAEKKLIAIEKAQKKYNDAVKKYGKNSIEARDARADLTLREQEYQKALGESKVELSETEKVMARFGLIMESTEKAQGDLARTLDSPSNKLRIQKERIKELGIELGTKLMPLVERGLDVVEDVVDWLSKLDEQQVEQIIKWGMVAAAAGPVLSIMGNMTTVIGGLGKAAAPMIAKMAIGKASVAGAVTAAGTAAGTAGGAAGMGALAGGLGAAALAAAPYVLAGAAVVGTGKLIYDNLTEEVVPAVDLFADEVTYATDTVGGQTASLAGTVETSVVKISDATRDAVQAYIDMDDQATEQLNELYGSSTTITSEIVEDMTTQFGSMADTIIEGYRTQKEESLKELTEFFAESSRLTSDEEQAALFAAQTHYGEKQKVVEDSEKRIKEIMNRASAAKRALTAEEVREINDLQYKMKEAAVTALSETEVEAKAILGRLEANKQNVTAKGAAEYISKLNQVRDEAVKAADDEYEKRVATVIKMRDELGVISEEQALDLIRSAEMQKKGTIGAAEDTRLEAIDKFRTLYKDLDKTVNTHTGKVLTDMDRLARWWKGWTPESKTFKATVQTAQITTTRTIQARAKGDRDFMGGLTTLHERGYEVYDLPQGTRIFPHEASEDIVEQTVNRLANQYIAGNEPRANQNLLSNIGQMIQGALAGTSGHSSGPIELVVNLDGKMIARQIAPSLSEIQGKTSTFNQLAYGRG